MNKWFLTALAAFSVETARAEEPPPSTRQRSEAARFVGKLSAIPKRVSGRMLGMFVQEGMAEDQVLRILGKHENIPEGSVNASVVRMTKSYFNNGVYVYFDSRGGDGYRVRSIYYGGLFD